jgi:hypothetical protein
MRRGCLGIALALITGCVREVRMPSGTITFEPWTSQPQVSLVVGATVGFSTSWIGECETTGPERPPTLVGTSRGACHGQRYTLEVSCNEDCLIRVGPGAANQVARRHLVIDVDTDARGSFEPLTTRPTYATVRVSRGAAVREERSNVYVSEPIKEFDIKCTDSWQAHVPCDRLTPGTSYFPPMVITPGPEVDVSSWRPPLIWVNGCRLNSRSFDPAEFIPRREGVGAELVPGRYELVVEVNPEPFTVQKRIVLNVPPGATIETWSDGRLPCEDQS